MSSHTTTGTAAVGASAIGAYCDQDDLEQKFGQSNILKWSDLVNNDAADVAVIQTAIDDAEEEIDDRFRGGKYAVPLAGPAGVPGRVKTWATKLAAVNLYHARGMRDDPESEKFEKIRDVVHDEINGCLAGATSLDADDDAIGVPTGPTLV